MGNIKIGGVYLHKDYTDSVLLVINVYTYFVRVIFKEHETEGGYFWLEANAEIDKLIYIGDL